MARYDIAITGGSGFIGTSLAKYLEGKFRVKILDSKPPSDQLPDGVDFNKSDVTRYDDVLNGIGDSELVIHTAIVQIPMINQMKSVGYDTNVLGIENVCRAVNRTESVKGLIHASSWHVYGSTQPRGILDGGFNFEPSRIDESSRFYALCKMTQEVFVRLYDEMSRKPYEIIRMGTVLGERMPEKTAANIFISQGLKGGPITPYRHSIDRAMFFVEICDVCRVFAARAKNILEHMSKEKKSSPVINLIWPEPVTILQLANIVRNKILECTSGKISPEIKIIDTGESVVGTSKYERVDMDLFNDGDLGIQGLISPDKAIEKIVRTRVHTPNFS